MKPETNYFDANTFAQDPVKNLYQQYKSALWFIIGMLIMGVIATYSFQSKYANLVSSIEDIKTVKEEIKWNNEQILKYINKNKELSDKLDTTIPTLLENVEKAVTPKKQTVVNQ